MAIQLEKLSYTYQAETPLAQQALKDVSCFCPPERRTGSCLAKACMLTASKASFTR